MKNVNECTKSIDLEIFLKTFYKKKKTKKSNWFFYKFLYFFYKNDI